MAERPFTALQWPCRPGAGCLRAGRAAPARCDRTTLPFLRARSQLAEALGIAESGHLADTRNRWNNKLLFSRHFFGVAP